MPRMIPENLDDITNSDELRVAELLRDILADDVIVFHGRHLLMQSKSIGLMPAEVDFIIVDPRQGVLVVEVKGGEVRYNTESKKWMHVDKNGNQSPLSSRDPYDQANSNMHNINRLLDVHIPNFKRKYRCGYAIALPYSRFEGPLPPNMNASTLIDARACTQDAMANALNTAFSAWKAEVTVLSDAEIATIIDTITPVYTVKRDLYAQFGLYEDTIHVLTEEQTLIYQDLLDSQNKAAIAGVAGSGKTLLAKAKALSEAQKGKRVLFLCYNKALAEWLNSSVKIGEIENGYLHIDNYHHFVAQLCRDNGRAWPHNDENLWHEYAPNQLYDIAFNLMSGQDKFDTIIVDEGQDFHPNWWASLAPLFRGNEDKQCYYVFYDPNQNIYQGQVVLPAGLTQPYPLRVNCRNTKRISDYCAQLLGIDMRTKKFAPEGIDPIYHQTTSLSQALNRAQQLAMTMIAEEQRLHKNQVAILCIGVPAKQMNAVAAQHGFTGDHKQWRNNEGVLVCAAGAFKGLESDLVIVVDIDSRKTPELISKRYVAFSRAKFELHVVTLN
jgi:hypothetical protein